MTHEQRLLDTVASYCIGTGGDDTRQALIDARRDWRVSLPSANGPQKAAPLETWMAAAPPNPRIRWLHVLGWTGAVLLTLAFSVAFVAWVVLNDPHSGTL